MNSTIEKESRAGVENLNPVNALSVDVEDYFQVSAFENSIRRQDWHQLEHRIGENMERVLRLFAESELNATFFMLGWIAERYPDIVRQIVGQGHELACHGYEHQRVTELSRSEFEQDVTKSKSVLEDISGVTVRGYRAPSYSIGESNVWALEVLANAGFEYSSSIYPIRHDLYGFPGAPRFPFRDERTGLIEVPITTIKFLNRAIPAGGGGFFRFYPYVFSRWIIRRVNVLEHQPVVFYFHPWELDPGQPRQDGISLKSRFRHYLNLDKTEPRLRRLVNDFRWGKMYDVFIKDQEIPGFALTP